MSLFLIGDGGDPRDGEPALRALDRALARLPRDRNAVVVFLGDNIYPKGMPNAVHPGAAEARRRLQAQREVLRSGPTEREGGRTRGIFIPGNHDWARSGKAGWAAVCRAGSELERLRAQDGIEAVARPTGACPGPWYEKVGTRLAILALDTQWWLHPGPKPPDAAAPDECGQTSCEYTTPAEVVGAVQDILERHPDVHTVVLAHHPLATDGPHGRGSGEQDLKGARYAQFLTSIQSSFSQAPPLLYAAGHDHNLQVLQPKGRLPLVVVSGSGSRSKRRGFRKPSDDDPPDHTSLFRSSAPGFMRLDVLTDGSAYLEVVTACCGSSQLAYSTWLPGQTSAHRGGS